jgi:hypothetical protein
MNKIEELALREIIKLSQTEYDAMIALCVRFGIKKEEISNNDFYAIKSGRIEAWAEAILENQKKN